MRLTATGAATASSPRATASRSDAAQANLEHEGLERSVALRHHGWDENQKREDEQRDPSQESPAGEGDHRQRGKDQLWRRRWIADGGQDGDCEREGRNQHAHLVGLRPLGA